MTAKAQSSTEWHHETGNKGARIGKEGREAPKENAAGEDLWGKTSEFYSLHCVF